MDCPVFAKPNSAPTSAFISDTVLFLKDQKELRHAVTGVLVGKPDKHTSEILMRLVVDPEMVSQLIVRKDPLAIARDAKFPRDTVMYLSVILYGSRDCFAIVGDFMTRCGRYLEDPVGCDRNVPYMNPHCLFSLYETPTMTLDLPPAPSHHVENIKQTYSDILAGFETTDPLYKTPTPKCLRTILKAYVSGTSDQSSLN
jgi:SWI/SNF-related matrix-associated actin-dependent regulator of chromatin subfamily A3